MNSQIWKLAEELITTEVLLNEYIHLQDTLYGEAVILTEGLQEGTPRFLSDKPQEDEDEPDDAIEACFRSLSYIKRSLGRAMDMETGIVNQYKSFVNKFKAKDESFDLPNKKTLKKSCKNCEEYQQVLEKFNSDFEKAKKTNAGLNTQAAKLQKDLAGYKSMYSELKASHEEVLNEFRTRVPHYEESEMRKSKGVNDKKQSENYESRAIERTLVEMNKKYEAEVSKNGKLQDLYEELLEESGFQQEKIEKAQVIIKKLNEECEKLAKELFSVEEELEFYKKDSKGAEKVVFEARKKFMELDGMKKTEERLREENLTLKEKILELSQSTETEKNHLKGVIEGLVYEKKGLEKDLEDLEEKLNEIDDMNKERTQAYNESCEQNRVLNEILLKKEEEICAAREEFKAKLENQAAELENVKKHAENLIRSLSGSKINTEKAITTGKSEDLKLTKKFGSAAEGSQAEEKPELNAQIKIKNLENQLQESHSRETSLKNFIQNLTHKEQNSAIAQQTLLSNLQSQFQTQLELLKMRNEELETILSNLQCNTDSLLRAINDYTKLVQIKDRQIEELQQLITSAQSHNDSRIENLMDAIRYLESVIKDEILPKSSSILDQHLDLAHKKIKNCQIDSERVKIDLEEAKNANERSAYRLEIAQNEFYSLSRTCSRYEQELLMIKASTHSPAVAIAYEASSNNSVVTSEILQKIKEIYEYNLALISQRTEARAALEKLESERQLFVNDMSILKENLIAKEKMMQEEQIRLSEQNEFLKTQTTKEKEEKTLIHQHWEEERNFFKSQSDYIKNILSTTEKEKSKIEAELKQSREEFKELLSGYERMQTEKNIVQKCYEELNQKIWSSSERLRNEWKKDSMSSSAGSFK